ncbi:MAG: hypothetical protein ACR2P1_29380 [Pseudomonadales bacterium]
MIKKKFYRVEGIEIENSTLADVYENRTTENTGGILVFDLPNLEVSGGERTRVYNNEVFDNNTANFAPEGNIVGQVPAGTGIVVMANEVRCCSAFFVCLPACHSTARLIAKSCAIVAVPHMVRRAEYDCSKA